MNIIDEIIANQNREYWTKEIQDRIKECEAEPESLKNHSGLSTAFLLFGDRLAMEEGEPEEALHHYKNAITIRNLLCQKEPNNHNYFKALADANQRVCFQLEDDKEQLPYLENEIAAREEAFFLKPYSYSDDLKEAYRKIIKILSENESGLPEAISFQKRNIEILETLYEKDQENKEHCEELAQSYNEVSSLIGEQRFLTDVKEIHLRMRAKFNLRYHRKEILAYREKEITLWEKLYSEEPDTVDYRMGLTGAYNKISQILRDIDGRSDEAESYRKKEKEIYEKAGIKEGDDLTNKFAKLLKDLDELDLLAKMEE